MKVLIIGGTGFIGPRVVRELVESGHAVTVFHRGISEAQLPAAVRHVHDDQASIPVRHFPPALLNDPPDVLLHMIAMGEEDTRAAVDAFAGRVQRAVWISSGDVYRAYGRFTGIEPGPLETGLLREDSPRRTKLYPYRSQAKSPDDLAYWYDKILMEDIALGSQALPGSVLRLPKVYGPGNNADLATVYRYRNHPQWRWTHGYVGDVAHVIVLAITRPGAARVYNVGEECTPTTAERLAKLPESSLQPAEDDHNNFEQDIAYDTSLIRRELGFSETQSWIEWMNATLLSQHAA